MKLNFEGKLKPEGILQRAVNEPVHGCCNVQRMLHVQDERICAKCEPDTHALRVYLHMLPPLTTLRLKCQTNSGC